MLIESRLKEFPSLTSSQQPHEELNFHLLRTFNHGRQRSDVNFETPIVMDVEQLDRQKKAQKLMAVDAHEFTIQLFEHQFTNAAVIQELATYEFKSPFQPEILRMDAVDEQPMPSLDYSNRVPIILMHAQETDHQEKRSRDFKVSSQTHLSSRSQPAKLQPNSTSSVLEEDLAQKKTNLLKIKKRNDSVCLTNSLWTHEAQLLNLKVHRASQELKRVSIVRLNVSSSNNYEEILRKRKIEELNRQKMLQMDSINSQKGMKGKRFFKVCNDPNGKPQEEIYQVAPQAYHYTHGRQRRGIGDIDYTK